MTTYLVLVKHSLPEIREDRPAASWQLSMEGRARAGRLAAELRRFGPEAIVSSPEPRAWETARILAAELQLDAQIQDGLQEHDRSNVPFLSAAAFDASIHDLFQYPDRLVFGLETADQAHARFYRAVHFVLERHPGRTVVIVTHGTVMSLFVSRLTGGSGLELWNQLDLPSFVALDLHSSTLVIRSSLD